MGLGLSGNAWHFHIRITGEGYLQGVGGQRATRTNAGTPEARLGLDYEGRWCWNLEGKVSGVQGLRGCDLQLWDTPA